MALDTRDKRAAAYGLGLYALVVGPTPDGAISTALDRQHVYGFARLAVSAAATQQRIRLADRGGLRLGEQGGIRVRDMGGIRLGEQA